MAKQPDPRDWRRDGQSHQPPNLADLTAHPPVGPACERTRQLLRDFVDADLVAESVAEVEAHVHQCRACALALARAESEALQLRQALGELDPLSPGPGPDFTETVLSQVGWVAVPAAEMQPSSDFTAGVMRLVGAEGGLAGDCEADGGAEDTLAAADRDLVPVPERRWGQPVWWAAAAVLVFSLSLGRALWTESLPFAGQVLRAQHTTLVAAADAAAPISQSLVPGAALTPDFDCLVAASGGFAFTMSGSPDEIATRVDVHGGAQLRRRGGRLEVVRGDLDLRVVEPLELAIDGGGRVDLAVGRYEYSAVPIRHQDSRLGVRSQLIVLEGLAQVVQGEQGFAVQAMQMATWSSFGERHIDVVPDAGVFAASRRQGAPISRALPVAAASDQPAFGRLLDERTLQPVVAGTVVLRTIRGTQRVQTDAMGRFRFDLDGLERQFGVLRALSGDRDGLCQLAAGPVPLGSLGGAVRQFILPREQLLRGRLFDADSRVVVGAQLFGVVVDEVFRRIVRVGAATVSDAGGNFVLRGFPASWPGNHSLLVLAQVAGQRPQIVLARTVGRLEDAALELRLVAEPTRIVDGLPPATDLHLLMPVRGMPLGLGAYAMSLRSDAHGRVRLPLAGPVYGLAVDQPPRLLSAAADGGPLQWGKATGLPRVILRQRAHGLVSGEMHWFAVGDRFAQLVAIPERGGLVSVHAAASGQAALDSQLFLVGKQGSRFLGIYDGRRALRCPPDAIGEIVAVTRDGRVGRHRLTAPLGSSQISIAVPANGQVRRGGGATSGLLELQRRVAGAPVGRALWVPVHRELGDARWILLPGTYRLGAQAVPQVFVVPPGGQVSLPARSR